MYFAVIAVAVLLAVAEGVRIDTETAYASRCALAAIQDHDAGVVPLFPGGPPSRFATDCRHGMIERSRHSDCDHVTIVYDLKPLAPHEVTYGEYTHLEWFSIDLSALKLDTKLLWEDEILVARLDPSRVGNELLVGCRPGKGDRQKTYEILGHAIGLTCAGIQHSYNTVYAGWIPRDARLSRSDFSRIHSSNSSA